MAVGARAAVRRLPAPALPVAARHVPVDARVGLASFALGPLNRTALDGAALEHSSPPLPAERVTYTFRSQSGAPTCRFPAAAFQRRTAKITPYRPPVLRRTGFVDD
ncbi:hypothetical protein [Kribbella sp. NPDC006257]|uniref:hypothetical protein n=1 Tax=Kribbella sp. NPDC006257 TaxID=3156738 RepID=UPI0033B0B848